jgi:hypothetical protein
MAHACSAAAVALAWTVRSGNVIAIPESGSVAHVKENAVALSLTLTPQEGRILGRSAANPDWKFPAESRIGEDCYIQRRIPRYKNSAATLVQELPRPSGPSEFGAAPDFALGFLRDIN